MKHETLCENIRRSFNVVELQRAYIQFPHVLPDGTTISICHTPETIGVAMVGDPDDASVVLCSWVWQKLVAFFPREALEDSNVVIFMRRWPTLVEYADEQGRTCTRLAMRLAIPGYKLQDIFDRAASLAGMSPLVL